MELPETYKCAVTEIVVGEGGFHKVFRYDMKLLVQYSACATLFTKGTVFTMDKTALKITGAMLMLLVFTASITLLLSMRNLKALLTLDIAAMKALAHHANSVLRFVLAMFISVSLTRWWALRVTALGKVFDALANTCMIVATELHDAKWWEVRNCVMKYGMASIELLVQAARDSDEIETLCEQDMDLLTETEVEFMREHEILWQRPMVIWAWIMHVITDAMDQEKVPTPSRQAVIHQCLNARDGMAAINMFLDTQLPFAYVHLITLLVNVQNVLTAVKAGMVFATAVVQGNSFVMVQQVFSTAIIVFIYQAVLAIACVVEDPFGDDVLDFPIRAYKAYVASIVDAMMGAGRGCPAVSSDGRMRRPIMTVKSI